MLIFIAASTTSLILIYIAASSASLIPICILALLGIYIFIEGVLKAQRFSFTSLDPVALGSCHSVALSRRVNSVSPSLRCRCVDL
jgi:hypothetical protein